MMNNVKDTMDTHSLLTELNDEPLHTRYDVVIIGGGWAGLTLARQLKRRCQSISILVLEASREFHAKVGEATVEMTGHYFMKQLGLVNYLYREQLPKNGLRFFYDSEDHSLPIHKMSEHGTTSIPPHAAFQLDRARLESDLVDMNRCDGVTILMGAKVTDFKIHSADELHEVQFQHEDNPYSVNGKWLIDCSGRNRVTRKHKKLTRQENVPEHFSAWGRFKNVRDIDSMGDADWQKKAFGRFLSTNHFSGDGYWIWFIPLSGGYTSVGLVGEKAKFENAPTKQDAFIDFLKKHAAISTLLEIAELADFQAYSQLAYRADEFIFEDRWATSGFASMFLDPLFSGGGDMIALFNDHITHYIMQDLMEENRQLAQQTLSEQLPIANKTVTEFYQGLYAHVANVYPVIDCAELCSPLLAYNTAAYFIEIAWDYMADHYLDQTYWVKKSYLRRGYMALERILQHQLLSTASVLKKESRYYSKNMENVFESGAGHYKYFVYQMGQHGKDGWRIDLRIKLWTEMYLKVLQAKYNLPELAHRFVVHQVLMLPDILEMHEQQGKVNDDDILRNILNRLSVKLTELLNDEVEDTIEVTVNQNAFTTDEVEICGWVGKKDLNVEVDGFSSDKALSEAELKPYLQKANKMWQQTQEYIAIPSMVPVFLSFARQQPDSIMTDTVDLRKVEGANEAFNKTMMEVEGVL